jgi:hypothetical protein
MSSPTRAAARSHDLLRDWAALAVTHHARLQGNHTPAPLAVAVALGFPTSAAPDGAFALPRAGVWKHDDAARLRLWMIGI